MKTLKIILASTLLMSVSAMGMTSKVKEPSKKVYSVLEGTTVNQITKSGLAVDLSYKSEHVEVGEISNINITLHTEIKEGVLKVNIRALENDLSGIEEQNLEFDLSKDEKEIPIKLQASSSLDGIHYINFTLSIEGKGVRVLAVPVNVGNITSKIENKATETTSKGVSISVSSADEVIK